MIFSWLKKTNEASPALIDNKKENAKAIKDLVLVEHVDHMDVVNVKVKVVVRNQALLLIVILFIIRSLFRKS